MSEVVGGGRPCPECGAEVVVAVGGWPNHYRADEWTPEVCPQGGVALDERESPADLEALTREAYRLGYRDRAEERDYDPGHAEDMLQRWKREAGR